MEKPNPAGEKYRPIAHHALGITPDFFIDDPLRMEREAVRAKCSRVIASVEGGIRIEGADRKPYNITLLDLFSVPPEVDSAELASKRLDIQEYAVEELDRLSACFRQAKAYIKDYLHISLPKEIDRITGFRTRDEAMSYFSYVRTVQKREKVGYAPYYCALAKITLAFWEFEKGEMQNLVHQTQYFYDALKNPTQAGFEISDSSNLKRFLEHPSLGERDNKEKDGKESLFILVGSQEETKLIHAFANYRSKTPARTVTKMIAKPEFNLQQAITDGVGVRFEIDSRTDAVELVTFLKGYLFHQSANVELRDHQFLSKLNAAELSIAGNKIKDAELPFSTKVNPASADEYESLNIRGDIMLPRHPDDPESMLVPRLIEIQVVLKGNKNEEGYNGHEIYEARQKLQAASRLFGVFSEEYFDLICAEASDMTEGKLTKEGIKKYIVDRKYITPVKVRRERMQKTKYCWTSHLKRWQQTGLLPQSIIDREAASHELSEKKSAK